MAGRPRSGLTRCRTSTAALLAAATALFVLSGQPPAARWRRNLRYATLAAYIAAATLAVVAVIVWLAGGR